MRNLKTTNGKEIIVSKLGTLDMNSFQIEKMGGQGSSLPKFIWQNLPIRIIFFQEKKATIVALSKLVAKGINMLVYRLEKPIEVGGSTVLVGPWVAACYEKELENVTWRYKRNLPGRCPEPKEDGISGFVANSDQVCGWYSYEGIYNWCRWKDDTEALQAVGFSINVYEVPEDKVLLGKTQCVWVSKYATLVKSVDWQEMVDTIESTDLGNLHKECVPPPKSVMVDQEPKTKNRGWFRRDKKPKSKMKGVRGHVSL